MSPARVPTLSAGMHHRLAPTRLLEDKLRRWLARQPESVRQGYWLGVLMADGQVTVTQLPEDVADSIEPARRGALCEECGNPLIVGADGKREYHVACKRAKKERNADEERAARVRAIAEQHPNARVDSVR